MERISPERKAATLAKLLPPYNMTVSAVAQMEGISEATLYNWRSQAKAEGGDNMLDTDRSSSVGGSLGLRMC